MALDQGTTSSRCIIFDRAGAMRSVAQKEFRQHYPKPGWVEHDAAEIWDTTLEVARRAMQQEGLTAADIAAIGITNQRETTVVWDKATGEPVCPAIVWQCRRTAPMADALVAAGWSDRIREKTGLVPDAYFSGTKLRWILDNVPGARQRAEAGELLFGTIDTWLIWKLTGGRAHVTDVTNASRTILFYIRRLRWDAELLELFGIPEQMLPKVQPSSCIYGESDVELFGGKIPVAGAAGDQQSALFGQCCFEAGDVKNTYGTGCFLLMHTGAEPVFSKNGLITTLAASAPGKIRYALEGSVFTAGAAVQWLRDELGLISDAAESEAAAVSVKDTGGVCGAGLHGHGRAVLEPICPRHDNGHNAGLHAEPAHPRYAGVDSVPDLRHLPGDGERRGRKADAAARGRRRVCERFPDAVPERPVGRGGAPPRLHRDNGAGRGLPGRSGGGLLEGHGRHPAKPPDGPDLPARDVRAKPRGTQKGLAKSP